MKENNRRYFHEQTKRIISESVPPGILKVCYPSIEEILPAIVTEGQTPDGNSFYLPKTKVILILPGQWDMVVHEAMHHFNHNGFYHQPVPYNCLDDLTAYFAWRIYQLEQENQRLRMRSLRNDR